MMDRPSLDADGHRAQVRRALVLDGDGDLAPAPPVQVPEGRSGPAPQDEEEAMALRVLQTKTIFLDDGDGAAHLTRERQVRPLRQERVAPSRFHGFAFVYSK